MHLYEKKISYHERKLFRHIKKVFFTHEKTFSMTKVRKKIVSNFFSMVMKKTFITNESFYTFSYKKFLYLIKAEKLFDPDVRQLQVSYIFFFPSWLRPVSPHGWPGWEQFGRSQVAAVGSRCQGPRKLQPHRTPDESFLVLS